MPVLKNVTERPRENVQIETCVLETSTSNLHVFTTTIIYFLFSYKDWANYLTLNRGNSSTPATRNHPHMLLDPIRRVQ